MLIYLIRNIINGKVYVGQTHKNAAWRLRRHFLHAKHGRTTHLCNAIRKYGNEAFSIEPLGIVESQDDLDYFEMAVIAYLDSTNPARGYNGTVGGEHGTLSDETKRRIGAANRGRPSWRRGKQFAALSEDRRKAIGDFHRGKKQSAEFVAKRMQWRSLWSAVEIKKYKDNMAEKTKQRWANMTPEKRAEVVSKAAQRRREKRSDR